MPTETNEGTTPVNYGEVLGGIVSFAGGMIYWVAILLAVGLLIYGIMRERPENRSRSSRVVATATSNIPVHIDNYIAPTGAWSDPVVILGDEWKFDTFASYRGNDDPLQDELVNETRSDERIVTIGHGYHPKLGVVYTLRFKSREASSVTGYVVQKLR